MMGGADLEQLRVSLGLSGDQVEKLQQIYRPAQKNAIMSFSAIRIAELDLADLLAADKVDLARVAEKLKEIEAARTTIALNQFRAAEEVKQVLTKEQLSKYGGMCQQAPAPQAPAQQPMQPMK